MRFPDDHPIAEVRGTTRRTPSELRRLIANRMTWLQKRIVDARAEGKPFTYFREELAALVQLLEVYDEAQEGAPAEETG